MYAGEGPPLVTSLGSLYLAKGLRRYMDLPKLVDLLSTKTLYLPRADKFPDRLEGALTAGLSRLMDEVHRSLPEHESASDYVKRARQQNFVSCWNMSLKDNMALWQLYGGAASSVALTTTVTRLAETALLSSRTVRIEKVEYIDHYAKNHKVALSCPADLLRYKHEAFKFEAEMRLIVPAQPDEGANGIRLKLVDLNQFIRSVVVSPNAPDWFFDVVVAVTRRFGVSKQVRRSRLTSPPS